jgi:hypothetical protein
MSKSPGLTMGLAKGALVMGIRTPSREEDRLWDAVQDAFLAGWTPEQLKNEVADAWADAAKEAAKAADRVLRP